MNRRQLLQRSALSALAVSGLSVGADTWAQASRMTRIVVGFPAGGGTDVFARVLAQGLAPELGQPGIVENKPGAGGVLASQQFRQVAPDGHMLLMGSTSTQVIAPLLYAKPPYQSGDFTPIAHVASVGIVLVAHPSAPFSSVNELVSYARQHPGKLSYASGGNGVTNHLGIELLKARTGTHLVHIPYRGSAPALNDVLGGQVPLMFDSVASSGAHVRAGKLKALGIAGPARLAALPDVPTISEAGAGVGLKGFDITGWVALYGPPKMSPTTVFALAKATEHVLASPEVAQRFAVQGASPHFMDSEGLSALEASETRKWKQAVTHSGARLD